MFSLKQADERQGERDLALYVHWPFCKSKCPYCDFNSHVRERVDHEDWKDAYLREMRHYRELTGARRIESVFFGGGTPSLMEPSTVAEVIDAAAELWGLPQGVEITLEANPTSVEAEKLAAFRSAGVNRVSLGIQSLRDADLKALGRQHSADEGLAALDAAARIFDRYSFDLIYARPGQTPEMWAGELSEALEAAGGHLSLYQLTIEEGTQFHTLFQRGELRIPDADAGAALYELTQEIMDRKGMPAYEISNHARAGDQSRHNLMYWKYRDYAGIGPGAHGRLTLAGRKCATRAHKAPEIWLERVAKEGHGAHPFEEVGLQQRGREMLMMGLRLSEGVDLNAFRQETGEDFSGFVNRRQATMLEEGGFLDISGDCVRATPSGRQRLDALLRFLFA